MAPTSLTDKVVMLQIATPFFIRVNFGYGFPALLRLGFRTDNMGVVVKEDKKELLSPFLCCFAISELLSGSDHIRMRHSHFRAGQGIRLAFATRPRSALRIRLSENSFRLVALVS